MGPKPTMWTTKDAAEHWGRSLSYVKKMIGQDRLEPGSVLRLGGGTERAGHTLIRPQPRPKAKGYDELTDAQRRAWPKGTRAALDECELCRERVPPRVEADRFFHQHHVVPRFAGGSDRPENLIRVCPNCHAKVHGTLTQRKAKEGNRYIGPRTKRDLKRAFRKQFPSGGGRQPAANGRAKARRARSARGRTTQPSR